MAQPVIDSETTQRETQGSKRHPYNGKVPPLTLLFVSRGGSCGFRHACATLITCSSFRGCSSTFAAKNNVVGDIICEQNNSKKEIRQIFFHLFVSELVNIIVLENKK